MKIQKYIIVLFIFLFPIIFSCTKQDGSAPETVKAETVELTEKSSENKETISINTGQFKHPQNWESFEWIDSPEFLSFIRRYESLREKQLILLIQLISDNNLDVNLESAVSLNDAGFSFYEKKKYVEAVRFFREAIYQDPSYVYSHYNLACTLSLLRVEIENNFFIESIYEYLLNLQIFNLTGLEDYDYFDPYYDEIYNHLTLSLLIEDNYYQKCQNDKDLVNIQKQLRFKRLISNIKNEEFHKWHGVWFNLLPDVNHTEFYFDQTMYFNNSRKIMGRNDFFMRRYFDDDENFETFEKTIISEKEELEGLPDYAIQNESGYNIALQEARLYPLFYFEDNIFSFEYYFCEYEPPQFIIKEKVISSRRSFIFEYSKNTISLPNGDILYNLSEPLFHAAWKGDLETIQSIENIEDEDLLMALRIAASYNQLSIVKYLINDKEISEDESDALFYAAHSGQSDTVLFLLGELDDFTIRGKIYNESILSAIAHAGDSILFRNKFEDFNQLLLTTKEEKLQLYSFIQHSYDYEFRDWAKSIKLDYGK